MGLTRTLTPIQEKAILGIDITLLSNEIIDSTIERFKKPEVTTIVENEFDYLILLKYLNSNEGNKNLQLLPNRLPSPCNLAGWAELDKLLESVDGSTTAGHTIPPLISNALALSKVRTDDSGGGSGGIEKIVASLIPSPSTTALLSHYTKIPVSRDSLLNHSSSASSSSSSWHFLLLWARVAGLGAGEAEAEAEAVCRALLSRYDEGGQGQGEGEEEETIDPVAVVKALVGLKLLREDTDRDRDTLKPLHDILAVAGDDQTLYTEPLARFLETAYASLRDTTTTDTTRALHWAKLAAQTGLTATAHSLAHYALWAHRAGDDTSALQAAKQAVKKDPNNLAWINLYAKLLTGIDSSSRDRALVVLSQVVAQLEKDNTIIDDPEWRKHAVHSHLLLIMLTGFDAVDVLPALFAFVNRVFPKEEKVKEKVKVKVKVVQTTIVKDTNSNTCIGGPREKLKSLLHRNRIKRNHDTIIDNNDNSINISTDTTTLSFMWTTLAKILYFININSAIECIDEARNYTPKIYCDYIESILLNDYTKIKLLIQSTSINELNQFYVMALIKLHNFNPSNSTLLRLQNLSKSPIWSRNSAILISIDKIAINSWFGLFIDDIEY